MIGFIVNIDFNRGFGFVSSDTEQNLYFKTNTLQEELLLGDRVIYEIKDFGERQIAIAIRKVFVNNYNIVFFPRINKHHIHLDLNKYFPPILNQIKEDYEEFIEVEYEFDDIIGKSSCVQTSSEDDILYAIRKGRAGHSRLVTNRFPEPCKHVFAAFKKVEEGYLILTIYVGQKAAMEPYDERASEEDLNFWKQNALIYEADNVIANSKLDLCPWVLNQPSICRVKDGPIASQEE